MYKKIVGQLLACSQRQFKIDFNRNQKVFRFSTSIFSSRSMLPQSIREYIEARKNLAFRPHKTSFYIDGNKVILIQEISFLRETQENLRRQVSQFCQVAKRCHQMLSEIAIEEEIGNSIKAAKFFSEVI